MTVNFLNTNTLFEINTALLMPKIPKIIGKFNLQDQYIFHSTLSRPTPSYFKTIKSSTKTLIDDFYRTDFVSRSSGVMVNCSKVLLITNTFII
jgi:hypothetical protein